MDFFWFTKKWWKVLWKDTFTNKKTHLKKYGVGKVGIRWTWTLATQRWFNRWFLSFQRVAQTIGYQMGKNTQKERKYLKASPQPRFVCFWNQMEIFLRISLRFFWCRKFLGVDLVFLLSAWSVEWSDLLPRMPKDTSFGKLQSRTSLQTPVCHHPPPPPPPAAPEAPPPAAPEAPPATTTTTTTTSSATRALGLDIPELPSICPGSWGLSLDHIIGSSFRSCGRLERVCQQEKLIVGTSTHHV